MRYLPTWYLSYSESSGRSIRRSLCRSLWLVTTSLTLPQGRPCGRPPAAAVLGRQTTAGRPADHRGPSASATANAKRRPNKQHRRQSKHKLLDRSGALAGQEHEVDQHEERDDYQEDGTYQRVHGSDRNRPFDNRGTVRGHLVRLDARLSRSGTHRAARSYGCGQLVRGRSFTSCYTWVTSVASKGRPHRLRVVRPECYPRAVARDPTAMAGRQLRTKGRTARALELLDSRPGFAACTDPRPYPSPPQRRWPTVVSPAKSSQSQAGTGDTGGSTDGRPSRKRW
jgi:hypothetical protein